MNKKWVISGVLALVIIAAVALFSLSTNTSAPSDTTVQTNESTLDPAKESDSTEVNLPGAYITLSERDANPANYATTKQVYFFHAEWCPICKGIDAEIEANPEKIPAGVTLIKTDFDANRTLRQQYGVTYQYTFVQIDQDGNEIAQWTADSLDKALAGIN